ncbi:MAG TPA: cytochrome P450, partial [Acidimicrobiales bacterium]|nr:cytochrome P450 [Acidimicrobiales bacterium]
MAAADDADATAVSAMSDDALQAMSVFDLATSDDPRAVARGLRETPVIQIPELFSLVTRRPDVEEALRRTGIFSWNAVGMDLGNVRPLIPLQIDPPKHVKYRRILDPLFAPKRMAELEGDVVLLVQQLVAKFAGRGSCDFHEEFAVPLPCTVFLRLLGLPYSDLDTFLWVKDDIIRPPGDVEEQARRRRKAGDTVYEYFEKVIAQRKTAPTDDVLTQIMNSEVDGERLTDEEVMDISYLFLIAGLDTVTDSLDCFFALLAQEPEHRRLVVEDESLIPSAVEELLRWESPVPAVPRRAVEDVEIAGCPIPAGEAVMLLLGSANTDHDAHPGLDTLDLARNPNPHLAFGGGV